MTQYALTIKQTLTVLDCAACGMVFGISEEFESRRRADHALFYCPAGHSQSYTGPSEAEKQRQRAERLERQLANKDEDLRVTRASLVATKGQLTKVKQRADRGVCQHCHRSFVNVSRHVATKHPEVTK
jgi:hypothetical protein